MASDFLQASFRANCKSPQLEQIQSPGFIAWLLPDFTLLSLYLATSNSEQPLRLRLDKTDLSCARLRPQTGSVNKLQVAASFVVLRQRHGLECRPALLCTCQLQHHEQHRTMPGLPTATPRCHRRSVPLCIRILIEGLSLKLRNIGGFRQQQAAQLCPLRKRKTNTKHRDPTARLDR